MAQVLLKNVPIIAPKLDKPSGKEGWTPRYGAAFSVAIDSDNMVALQAAMLAACVAAKADATKGAATLKTLTDKGLTLVRDVNEDREDATTHKLVSANRSTKKGAPDVRDRGARPIDPIQVTAGSKVNAIVDVWFQAADKAKGIGERINAELVGVQLIAAVGAVAAFEALEETDDDLPY